MRRSLLGAVQVIALALLILPASAQEKRIALVIGNSAYKESPLKNPVNDARLVAAKLQELGFDVTAREDATRTEMAAAVRTFLSKLSADAVAVIYYAGHGIQSRGRNYLIPVDASVSGEGDLWSETVELGVLMLELEEAQPRITIVVLDACRNNPFERRFRGGSRGLAAIDAARGSLIAYATAPGTVAADGAGANAPYTEELVKALSVPDLKAEEVFKRVTAAVEDRTKGAQTPWISSSLRGDFIFNRSGTATAAAANALGLDRETLLWQSVERSHTAEEYRLFLSQFPNGIYAPFARRRIEALKNDTQHAAVQGQAAVELDVIDREFVATNVARLRAAPDVRSEVLGLVSEGDTILVLGKVKGEAWYQVERKGQTPAYVSAASLEKAVVSRKREDETQQRQQAVVAPGSGAAPLARSDTPAPAPGHRDCTECPELAVIPGGSFTMGSPAGEDGRDEDEGPLHFVSIASFALGKYEVTRGEFAAFARESGYAAGGDCLGYSGDQWGRSPGRNWRNPDFAQTDRDPVVCVNWDDAKAYVAWLSGKTGRRYRLPSEAEWEYAARAGSTSARPWGSDSRQACEYANVASRSGQRNFPRWTVHDCGDGHAYTAPVGSYRANSFGLHDMVGNVEEWTEDCYNSSYEHSPRDGRAWLGGNCNNRVLRGGSWLSSPGVSRSANRTSLGASTRIIYNGFRVARSN